MNTDYLSPIWSFVSGIFGSVLDRLKTPSDPSNTSLVVQAPLQPEEGQGTPPAASTPDSIPVGETTLVTHINVPVETPRNITWVPSPNFSSRNGSQIRAIILHDTASTDLKSALSWLIAPVSKVSAHYLIDTNGDIYQLVKESDRAYHAGNETNSILHGIPGVNAFSIGIEIVGDGIHEFTRAQYEATAWVVNMLKVKYNIANDWIVGHKDVALPPGRKTDPSPFNWPLLWALLPK